MNYNMPYLNIPTFKQRPFGSGYKRPNELVHTHWWARGYGYASTLRDTTSARWWTPIGIVGIVYGMTVAFTFILLFVVLASWFGQNSLSSMPAIVGSTADGELNPVTILMLFGSVAIMLPALWFAIYWMKDQSFGSLSSVFGHIRWKALGYSTLVAFIGLGLYFAYAITTEYRGHEISFKTPSVIAIILILTLIPVQCMTEEYIFRGVLIQAFGKWLPRKVHVLVPIIPALIFASMHTQYGLEGKTEVFSMGLLAGYATMYLGGLEAGMGLHIANNILATLSAAITTDTSDIEESAQITWADAGADALTQFLIIATIIICAHIFAWFDNSGVDLIGNLSKKYGVQRPSHLAKIAAKEQVQLNQALQIQQMYMMQAASIQAQAYVQPPAYMQPYYGQAQPYTHAQPHVSHTFARPQTQSRGYAQSAVHQSAIDQPTIYQPLVYQSQQPQPVQHQPVPYQPAAPAISPYQIHQSQHAQPAKPMQAAPVYPQQEYLPQDPSQQAPARS